MHVGVNADMMSKWERGEKRPSALYARMLSGLFEASPAELGLAEAGGTPGTPAGARFAHSGVLDMLGLPDGTPGLLDLLLPKMLEIGRQELLNRRQMLQAMGLAPAAVGFDALSPEPPASRVAAPSVASGRHLDRLRAATRELEVLYHSADPRRLTTPVGALAWAIEDALPDLRDQARRRLGLRLLSRANLLAGRVALFDLRRPLEARAHLDLAREAARRPVTSYSPRSSSGTWPSCPGSRRTTRPRRRTSRRLVERHLPQPGPVKAWLCAVDGELNTWARSFDLAHKAHDRARTLMADDDTAPTWFDFFDEARLGRVTKVTGGVCGVAAGQG
jgi:hypothetical protein